MRKLSAAAAALAATSLLALAAPATAQEATASVVVVHGIPDTPVDVYVNDDLTLDDFQPGTVTDALDLPGGTYQLDLRAPDAEATADPILSAEATVEGGGNYTIVAHLTADGSPTITPFVNDTTVTKAGEGGLVVRHTAAAPAVDVYAGDAKVIESLENPDSAGPLYVPAGTVSASVTAAGATDPVIGPADVPVVEGTVTIVYATGSLEAGNLGVAVQQIEVGSEPSTTEPPATTVDPPAGPTAAPIPTGVDAGDSGLAAEDDGANLALLATIAGLALVAGATGAVSLARARRQD
jgi:hypothetical protein